MLKFLVGVGVLGLALFAVWKIAFPTYTHRYRLTIDVQVGDQIKSGSGVIEVTNYSNGPLEGLIHGTHSTSIEGRAPIIELGSKGLLLAMLGTYRPVEPDRVTGMRPMSARFIAPAAFYGERVVFRDSALTATDMAGIDGIPAWQAIASESGKKPLPLDYAPEFVWFSNPLDRSTAIPMTVSDVPHIIGPDVQVKAMSVEITTDGFSDEIYEKLPWLAEIRRDELLNSVIDKVDDFKVRSYHLLGGR